MSLFSYNNPSYYNGFYNPYNNQSYINSNNNQTNNIHSPTNNINVLNSNDGLNIILEPALDKNIKPDGVFSFSLYYDKNPKGNKNVKPFKETLYYTGLYCYLHIIHNYQYFKNWYIIIYTNKKTIDILREAYPFSKYNKIIFAICEWPMYEIDNSVDNTIITTLRYHAELLFPYSCVALRDADSIFDDNFGYSSYFGFQIYNESGLMEVFDKIAKWEQNFLENVNKLDKFVIIGANTKYHKEWHKNIPMKKTFNPNIIFYTNNVARKKDKDNLFFKSPFGVYAGFVTFLKNRKINYWPDMKKYLTDRYYILEHNNKYIISNSTIQPWTYSLGKDERIIIFTLIVNHLDDCYFYYIPYDDDIHYYTDIIKNEYDSDVIFKSNIIKNANDKIKLIDANYDIATSYITDNNISFNDYLYSVFNKFSYEYKLWLNNYNNMFNKRIKNMSKVGKFFSNNNNNSNTLFGKFTRRFTKRTVRPKNIFINKNGGKRYGKRKTRRHNNRK
jgi:hypothetical protein